MAMLERSNIVDGQLTYYRRRPRSKSSSPCRIRLLKLFTSTITSVRLTCSRYFHRFIRRKYRLQTKLHKVLAKVNKYLKDIGDKLKLPLPLTTYVARHSYATVLKRAGVSTAIISESLGHSSEKITQTYLDSFDNEQVDEAMKNLL